MKLGFIGLGKMGNRMVTKLLLENQEVVVWNRTKEKVDDLVKEVSQTEHKNQLTGAQTVEELINNLNSPKIVWLMLPEGKPTQELLDEVEKHVKTEDIIIDGGNSFYEDTQKRFDHFQKKGLRFLGIGVSGGIVAAKDGYPIMAGGDKSAYEKINEILASLAKPGGGHAYFGEGGAGHFVKMVHNAIEYGYMQSIGEGFGILEKSPYNLDLLKVANLYQKGTLVSGFMMARTMEVLEKDPQLETIAGVIGKASGETIWTVELAKKQGLPVDVIKRSLEIRNESETDEKIQKSYSARMVAALRNAFGGHEVKKKES